jgi:ABC-type spermidine/putrescine transport system permease subunit I
MLKLYWSLGGSVARPAVYTEGFPMMELVCLAAGALLSLALVQSWGRRLPRVLVLIPAWFATSVLVSMAALMVFGTTSQLLGITDGPVDFSDKQSLVAVGTVYLSWLVFGLTLGGATLAYQRTTRHPGD